MHRIATHFAFVAAGARLWRTGQPLLFVLRQGAALAAPQRCNRHRHPEGAQRPKDLLLWRRLYAASICFV
jgi:hypothetical protein